MAALRSFSKIFLLLLFLLNGPMTLMAQDPTSMEQQVNDDQSDKDADGKKKKKKDTTDKDNLSFEFKMDKMGDRFFARLFINLLSVFILIRLIYYVNYKNGEFFFTFFVFNFVIFLITYLLNKVDMSLGAAFGLFAVFSMLRYRTEGISARDMTYLFCVIAIGLITAVSKGTALELTIINLMIIAMVFIMESSFFMKKEFSQVIQYENIEMIGPDKRQELVEDLKKRTGLNIHRISITKVDFLRDTAVIRIYYYG